MSCPTDESRDSHTHGTVIDILSLHHTIPSTSYKCVCGRLLTTLPLSCHSGDIHLLDKMSHNMKQFGQVTLNIT